MAFSRHSMALALSIAPAFSLSVFLDVLARGGSTLVDWRKLLAIPTFRSERSGPDHEGETRKRRTTGL
jgi:hypothetical protein